MDWSSLLNLLAPLPEGAALRRDPSRCDLLIWFTTSRAQLEQKVDRAAGLSEGEVWIAWPKKGSGVRTDLTQNVVREVGLARGLVDYKICVINSTWSALRFKRRS